MAEYGKIFKKLWRNAKFRKLSDQGKLLCCYIFSCPHCNSIGLYSLDKYYICADLEWLPKRLDKPFRELLDQRFISYDNKLSVILVHEWFKYNSIQNDNQYKKAEAEFSDVPQSHIFQEFKRLLERLPEGLHKRLLKPLGKRLPNPETETESETETKAEDLSSKLDLPPDFELVFKEIIEDFLTDPDRSEEAAKLVKERLKKFSKQDFFNVHTVKSAQWKSNPDMNHCLRPTTLYLKSHFSEYLGEYIPISKTKSPEEIQAAKIRDEVLNAKDSS